MYNSEKIVNALIESNKTITFMESCTSGLLASIFTDTPGASSIFKGSLVTYSNEEKINAGVAATIIETFGVYSEECAEAMAKAAKERYNTDIAIGITSTTGNIDKENLTSSIPGICYVCILIEDIVYHLKLELNDFQLNLTRAEIKQYYSSETYSFLEKILHLTTY